MVHFVDDGIFSDKDRRQRRLLRQAVNLRNTNAFQDLIAQGCDVNMIMSPAYGDTILKYLVKRGSLEMVEFLLCFNNCALDKSDRIGKTPLDEALSLWMQTAMETSNDSRQTTGRRYRILKRLLSAGAYCLSHTLLNKYISNALNMKKDKILIEKLCKTFAINGSSKSKGNLVTILLPLKKTSGNIQLLLRSGAEWNVDIHRQNILLQASSLLPMRNVITLLCATHNDRVIGHINKKIITERMFEEWHIARHAFTLVCLLGKQPSLLLIKRLFYQQPIMYKWYIQYQRRPPPLKHLARLRIRQGLQPNVLAGSHGLNLPVQLRNYLIFKKM